MAEPAASRDRMGCIVLEINSLHKIVPSLRRVLHYQVTLMGVK
jgi:hypothetical protein